jgi:hypothetical protein
VAAAGAGIFNPISAVAISPLAGQAAIRGVSTATKAPVVAAVSNLAARQMEQEDHPQLSDKQADLIVKQEKEKDPNFYVKEAKQDAKK